MKISATTPQQLLTSLIVILTRERNSVAAASQRLLISTPTEQTAVLRTYDEVLHLLSSIEIAS